MPLSMSIPARKSRRKLVRFYLATLAAPAAVIGSAAEVALLAAVTLAVGAGIPCAIAWALYSMWRVN